MQDIMQWATVYAMPLALGVTKTFGDEVDVVKEVDPIFYWWQPLGWGPQDSCQSDLRQQGMSFYEASCQWIRNNRDRWGAWVSGALSCSSGNGLADAAGAFLTSRENARICKRLDVLK
eukprot:Skav208520  [mRNA]  locus=scaffold1322:217813:223527:- [translate_table: standard]